MPCSIPLSDYCGTDNTLLLWSTQCFDQCDQFSNKCTQVNNWT